MVKLEASSQENKYLYSCVPLMSQLPMGLIEIL